MNERYGTKVLFRGGMFAETGCRSEGPLAKPSRFKERKQEVKRASECLVLSLSLRVVAFCVCLGFPLPSFFVLPFFAFVLAFSLLLSVRRVFAFRVCSSCVCCRVNLLFFFFFLPGCLVASSTVVIAASFSFGVGAFVSALLFLAYVGSSVFSGRASEQASHSGTGAKLEVCPVHHGAAGTGPGGRLARELQERRIPGRIFFAVAGAVSSSAWEETQ